MDYRTTSTNPNRSRIRSLGQRSISREREAERRRGEVEEEEVLVVACGKTKKEGQKQNCTFFVVSTVANNRSNEQIVVHLKLKSKKRTRLSTSIDYTVILLQHDGH